MVANGKEVDHFTDDDESDLEIDYTDIEERFRPKFQDTFDNLIVVEGAPIVDEAKRGRLVKAIVSTFAKKDLKINEANIEMPLDQNNQSKGYLFIELNTPQDADRAVRNLHDYPFDKKHRFTVIKFTEVERFAHVAENFVPPVLEEYKPRSHLKNWLADPQGRDQMVIYQGDDVKIAWHARNGTPEVAHKRNKWTDAYCTWSPDGTMLATIHNQGVALWGGANFDRIHRLYHPKVKLIDFSPMENYLVTWSDQPIELPNDPNAPRIFSEDDEGNSIAVWEVVTGKLLRTFPVPNPSPEEEGGARIKFQWPMFKWSGDDRYLARVTPGQAISVYETPGMGLLEKKSIKIEGVVDFEWCPLSETERDAILEAQNLLPSASFDGPSSDSKPKKNVGERSNMLAFWTPEVANQPARVSLMNIPSRDTLRSKNLFNVHDAKIHWQSNGDYVCVKVDRHTKTKKTTYCNLELFRVRDKSYPVDVIEIKDTVTAFAWEPKGNRFVLITSNDPNLSQGPTPGTTIKTSIHFFGMDVKKGDFRLFTTYDGKTCNSVHWSPKGRHVVTATLGSSSKFDLEFWDTDLDESEKDLGSGISLLSSVEHYGMTELEWDPSGRYLASIGSMWLNSLETGYVIWDFKGEQLHKGTLERFKQLVWRPRPRSLLSRETQRKIRKNLREYSKQFEEEDQLEASNVSAELVAHRRRLLDEWDSWRRRAKLDRAADAAALGKATLPATFNAPEDPAESQQIEEWIEEVIEETETLV
ncbi:hypothetical protein PCANC_15777 [Puccinia coronata f. sp. avenae]|uniref:Eukaryotic translation initiation factor 3 subunit B n=1 Tax=Puccinia coronata f. sp. avenae TaxID=200324 RepID=A0A2N5SYX8_9BASI|nr:hypothetical protein PCANC_15777 [Puccinia coronata f. sp. avenae]